MSLTFEDLANANLSRAYEWHKGGLEVWSVSDWAVETWRGMQNVKAMERERN